MVYGELKHFMWYMVNFEETEWYIMKYPFYFKLNSTYFGLQLFPLYIYYVF